MYGVKLPTVINCLILVILLAINGAGKSVQLQILLIILRVFKLTTLWLESRIGCGYVT